MEKGQEDLGKERRVRSLEGHMLGLLIAGRSNGEPRALMLFCLWLRSGEETLVYSCTASWRGGKR